MQEVKIAKTELFEGTTCQICTVHCVHLSLQFLFGLSLSESYEIAVHVKTNNKNALILIKFDFEYSV